MYSSGKQLVIIQHLQFFKNQYQSLHFNQITKAKFQLQHTHDNTLHLYFDQQSSTLQRGLCDS